MITFCPELQNKLSGPDAFEKVFALQGLVYRNFKGRKTLRFEHEGKGYFAKIHPGVGWGEIIRTLLHFKIPVLSARDEYEAIKALEKIGVQTMSIAGYGFRGRNPAKLESFIITEEIEDAISLEELALSKDTIPLAPRMKRAIIIKVAEIARLMHQNGVNHRDFYICHFLLSRSWLVRKGKADEPPLYVIDLHRTQVRQSIPLRWLKKDLAGLYFSSLDAGLTLRDRLRFISQYEGCSIKEVVMGRLVFWNKLDNMAAILYQKFCRRMKRKAKHE